MEQLQINKSIHSEDSEAIKNPNGLSIVKSTILRRTVIIKRIKDYLEETKSTQKPHLEKYTYQELKKVLYLYNLTEDEINPNPKD